MRSRLALAASSLAAVLALAGAAPGTAAVDTETTSAAPATCPDLAGAAAGSTLDAMAVATCVRDAVMEQEALKVTLTGTFPGTVWVSHKGATKVLARLGDSTRVLILPKAAFVKRHGVAQGRWVRKKPAAIKRQLPQIDPSTLLAALQPCATLTGGGTVSGGVQLSCPADMQISLMGFTVDVAKASAVIDPATWLPASAELEASAAGFAVAEQVAFDWDQAFNWGTVRKHAFQQARKARARR